MRQLRHCVMDRVHSRADKGRCARRAWDPPSRASDQGELSWRPPEDGGGVTGPGMGWNGVAGPLRRSGETPE